MDSVLQPLTLTATFNLLSTPCNGFGSFLQLFSMYTISVPLFQLHVMDSGPTELDRTLVAVLVLSTPCNGFGVCGGYHRGENGTFNSM